jgi:diacylglycerol kinase
MQSTTTDDKPLRPHEAKERALFVRFRQICDKPVGRAAHGSEAEASAEIESLKPQEGRWQRGLRGLKRGIRQGMSFFVHFFVAAAVGVTALTLGASWVEWAILLVCITAVLAAEMFYTALARLAALVKADDERDLRNVLDIGQAAVLIVGVGAAIVISLILFERMATLMGEIGLI